MERIKVRLGEPDYEYRRPKPKPPYQVINEEPCHLFDMMRPSNITRDDVKTVYGRGQWYCGAGAILTKDRLVVTWSNGNTGEPPQVIDSDQYSSMTEAESAFSEFVSRQWL
jgi:hypothetical protein